MSNHNSQSRRSKAANRSIQSVGVITGVPRPAPGDPLAFILSENAYGNDVICLLRADQAHMSPTDAALVRVTGSIVRDAASGRARHVTAITAVTAIESPAPGAYRNARGAIPWQTGDPMPEESIRKMRDDWNSHPAENPAPCAGRAALE